MSEPTKPDPDTIVVGGTTYEIVERTRTGHHLSSFVVRESVLDRRLTMQILSAPDEAHRRRMLDGLRSHAVLAGIEGIVPVLSVQETADRGGIAVVTPCYNRGDLARIRDEMGLPVAAVNAIKASVAIADAIGAAHRFGILHGSLGLSSLVLDRRGGVAVADFGISSAIRDPSRVEPTPPDQPVAPELMATGAHPTTSSDIYAIVAILFELLTGQTPGVPQAQLPSDRLVGPVLPPDALVQLQHVIRFGLDPNPSARFATAEQLAQALRTVLRLADSLSDLDVTGIGGARRPARAGTALPDLGTLTGHPKALAAGIHSTRDRLPRRLTRRPPRPTRTGVDLAGAGSDADFVDCSVFAERDLRPGGRHIVQVWTHLLTDAERASEMAELADAAGRRRAVHTMAFPIERGRLVHFEIDVPGCFVEPARGVVRWNGQPTSVQFIVSAPHDVAAPTVATVHVVYDEVPIGRISFSFGVSSSPSPAAVQPAGDGAMRYRRAFLSYASADRAEVLNGARVLDVVGMEHFLDVQLSPGERWEQRLYEEIDACDLFQLFWSSNAKESVWVRREAAHALCRERAEPGGIPHIQPVIVEGPPTPRPWPELSALHFGDRLAALAPRTTNDSAPE